MLDKSKALFQEAKKHIPGGVNSPVRACLSVDSPPVFMEKGEGGRIFDVDGNSYHDLVNSWGPLIFGHCPAAINQALIEVLAKGTSFGAATEGEIRLAALISECLPSLEMVRLVNSGTEAAMTAIRLARGFTGRDKIIKFQGCYHGHADSLLVDAGSGVATLGIPGCPGIPEALASLTLTVPYNDVNALTECFNAHGHEVAALIVEPVAGNMGLVLPQADFLAAIENLCRQSGALFICDEVITGFRLSLGGAQKLFNLKPDLTILGKIIGGGLPLAAFGGRREVMERLAPVGDVYQAGTLSGNPLAVAAGIAAITELQKNPAIYEKLQNLSQSLAAGLVDLGQKAGLKVCANQIGSLSTLFFTDGPVVDYASAKKADTKIFAKFWRGMLAGGVFMGPSQFECNFTSGAQSPLDMADILQTAEKVFQEIKKEL